MKMMTSDEIRAELGWTDSLIYSLLQDPDSPHARRDKHTGGYTYGLYHRDRGWPSLNRRKAALPSSDGMRRCVATRPTPGGRPESAT